VEHLIGVENKGFGPIMNNFNHERWSIAIGTLAGARNILRETILWANQRKVQRLASCLLPLERSTNLPSQYRRYSARLSSSST
jgi:alkylation response protein AidB-like acyl-CoA dehydrogenase